MNTVQFLDDLDYALEAARESVDWVRGGQAGRALEDLLGVVEIIAEGMKAVVEKHEDAS